MAMGAASIALLLLFVAAAGTSAAAAVPGGGTTTIRLPSDAARAAVVADDDLARAMAAMAKQLAGDEERPWGECCDLALCTRSDPPLCRCLDVVDQCSDACKDCVETLDSRHACADMYRGDPGPLCYDYRHGRGGAGGGLAADDDARQAAVVADGKKAGGGGGDDDEKRPWGECCDLALCTLSIPPRCRCLDPVHSCPDACSRCEQTAAGNICVDFYTGDPGPRCHDYGHGRAGLADPGKAAAAVAANDRKAGGGDVDKKRPWKCCDMAVCTRSWPPVCICLDTVERCASTCKHCEQVAEAEAEGSSGGGPRYRCLDPHRGDPGPRCREQAGAGGDHDWARRLAMGHRF